MFHQTHHDASPFHRGEKLVQEQLGVSDIEQWARRVVVDHLPAQHREFHTALPFIVAGARDATGRPWATLLTGPSGFITAPDSKTLQIDAQPVPGDALEGALSAGADLGLLGIEFATRRRNRVNGRIAAAGPDQITFSVGQAFGNCPQYIRERGWRYTQNGPKQAPLRSTELSKPQRAWIGSADAFFIASGYRGEGNQAAFGMDVSHRGGDPGYVQVIDNKTIVFPDYAGNNHFNTIGNLLLDPRAGFLFVDFATGSLLQITGTTTIDWSSENVRRFPGARRLVSLSIEAVVELQDAVPLRWETSSGSVRSMRLVEKTRESADVTSFHFEARDGGKLPLFQAGQHLPIVLEVPGFDHPVERTYSLSAAPNTDRYRITVKREAMGIMSRYLHDYLEVGAIIDARIPSGEFVLPENDEPIVLVSAGVGLTPLVSMLHQAIAEHRSAPIWFVHGARDGDHHPLFREVCELAKRHSNIRTHVAYSRPKKTDRTGIDFDSEGRITADILVRLCAAPNAHYLICGPTAFMGALQSDLLGLNVAEDHIHSESFGPVG